jgi:hypothetical protein
MTHFDGITQRKALAKNPKKIHFLCVIQWVCTIGNFFEKETRHFCFYEMLTPFTKEKFPCKT